MRVHILNTSDGTNVKVTLSRRNLQTLLYKLDVPDSKRTLTIVNDVGDYLEVQAEEDEIHYADRAPGVMHPREEARFTAV